MSEEKLYLADGFREIGQRIGGFCVDNRAHILTGLGVAGTITTGVLSAKSGARAARKIDKRERELKRRLTFKEKVSLCGPDFILPAAAGILSVAGTVGSDVVNTRVIGERTALLIASEKAYEQLSRKTKEVLGEKKAKQVQDEIAKENLEKSGVITQVNLDNAPRTGSGQLYPYVDDFGALLFWSNPDYIACHVKCLQEMMRDLPPRGDEYDYHDKEVGVPYSEWLKGLGFEPKVYNAYSKQHFGWNKGYTDEDNDPIEYTMTPIEWDPGFSVMEIRWQKMPTDLRLGRIYKSTGI